MISKFSAVIEIIGINPFVHLPQEVLQNVFLQAQKDKGKIPVKVKIDGHEFFQTLVKYSGYWRLYLNTPMRQKIKKEVGATAAFEVVYHPEKRIVLAHPKLLKALDEDENAKKAFYKLAPYLQLEICKYLSFLKTEESLIKNVHKIILYLKGEGSFFGRKLN